MIQKNSQLVIDPENIFANDKLDRESTIRDLSQLLINTHDPFVLSINASWGAGKTTFVKMWKAFLEKEHGVQSVYFSAWEDDFSKEPLISILGELDIYLKNNYSEDEEVLGKFAELKQTGGKVVKRGLPAFISGMTSGALDLEKGVEKAISAMTESVAKELIDSYQDDKKVTIKFKEALGQVIKQIDPDKPFIIFVDELDRCRPLYAIELLERIKHVFGIEKVVFVLSIDKKQLSESIKSQYGNIDTENYLRRFIDLEYILQNPDIRSYCETLSNHYNLDKDLKLRKLGSSFYMIESPIIELSKKINISLREIEKIYIKLSIIIKTIETYEELVNYKLEGKVQEENNFIHFVTYFIVVKNRFPEINKGRLIPRKELERLREKLMEEQNIELWSYFQRNFNNKVKPHTGEENNLDNKISLALGKIDFTDGFYYAYN